MQGWHGWQTMSQTPGSEAKMDDLNLPNQIPIDDGYYETRDDTFDDADSNLSIASSRWNRHYENGRFYRDYRRGSLFPDDEESGKNESYFNALLLCILENKWFFAPVNGDSLDNILQLGHGEALWAEGVADKYPNCTVHGIDPRGTDSSLYDNVKLQTSDLSDEWIFDQPNTMFDYVHMRNIFATLSNEEWLGLYQQCFK
jgi:hypothetical protein